MMMTDVKGVLLNINDDVVVVSGNKYIDIDKGKIIGFTKVSVVVEIVGKNGNYTLSKKPNRIIKV